MNGMPMLKLRRRKAYQASHFYYIPQIIAILIVAPILWAVFDRTPPLKLYDGSISPQQVARGQNVSVIWHARFSGRDCPGLSQRELVDADGNLWPKLARGRKGIFRPNPLDKKQGIVTTPPLSIPDQMSYGVAQYRVTQFYYCNWLQKIMRWPIVEVSPPIQFEVVR